MVTIMAEQSIAEQLRNDSDDPYFMVAPENNGDDLKWLQRNWALREAAAIYIDRLTKERDAAVLAEREAIAKWHDKMAAHYRDLADTNGAFEHRYRWHEHCKSADAIRARSNTDTGPQAQVRAEAAPDDLVRRVGDLLMGRVNAPEQVIYSAAREIVGIMLAASPTPPAAEAVGKWQDISTAPRDGTQVDLWCTAMGGTISAGGYSRTPDCWFSAGRWWRYDEQHGDDQCRSEVCNVTHWMPLPAPPLQRERGAVAGRDGSSISCALKGTGPAASTASDDLVKEIGQSMDVQYAIGSIINNEGSFFTGRGERMDRLVRAVLSSPPVLSLRSSLFDLVEAVEASVDPKETCAALWSRVDDSRSILSRFQSEGGEKHDHADGTSAEAVEKVTQPK